MLENLANIKKLRPIEEKKYFIVRYNKLQEKCATSKYC